MSVKHELAYEKLNSRDPWGLAEQWEGISCKSILTPNAAVLALGLTVGLCSNALVVSSPPVWVSCDW